MLNTAAHNSPPTAQTLSRDDSGSTAQSAKRLIVNADDLGLSRGITDGIFLAHREGIVTSASLMVNQPATEYAIEQWRDAPTLDVGIHLNLCQGKPVLPAGAIPSLVGSDGLFLRPREIAKRLTFWQASPREIEAEFRAQIDRMLSYGITPSHADSHHRFHIYPAAASAFAKAIRSRGISKARAARKKTWPDNGGFVGTAHAGPTYRRLAVNAYNNMLERTAFRNLTLPDAGVALHPRFRGNLERLPRAWSFAFEHMPFGTYEIWCHPGRYECGFSETDALSKQREVELAMLTEARLRQVIQREGIELVTFREL